MNKSYADYRGVRNLVAALVLTDNGAEYVADKWHELEGAVSVNIEGEESTGSKYRDNLPVGTISTEGPDTATVNMDVLANKVRAWLEGRSYSEDNDVYIKTPKKNQTFVFGCIAKKDNGTEEAIIMYSTAVTGGNEEHATEDDGTDVTTVEYTFTGSYTKTKFQIGDEKLPVKRITVPLSAVVTEEKLFGVFTDGVSTVSPLDPAAIIALKA